MKTQKRNYLQGEYCFSYFIKNKDKILDNELLKDSVSATLEDSVNNWFEYITGGKLVAHDIALTDKIRAGFIGDSGRQLIIETHSDHIFNGTRAALSNGEIDSEQVSLNFLSLDKRYCTVNNTIKIEKKGRIINTPRDLFDQLDIDHDKMLGL